MTKEELTEFAGRLGRHLATVLASEHGYAEVVCPDCSVRGGKHRALPAVVQSATCRTCDGMQRLWRKTSNGDVRRLSDRQVIETLGGSAA